MELSGLFVYLGGLVKLFSSWRTEKIVGLWFAGEIATQADIIGF